MEIRERICTNENCLKTDNPPDAEFCGGCGLPFLADEPSPTQNYDLNSIQEAQPVPSQDSPLDLIKDPTLNPDLPSTPKQKPKPFYGFETKHIAIAVAGLIILIGAIAMIWYFGGRNIPSDGQPPIATKKPLKLKLATYWRSDLPILVDNVKAMAKDISDESNGELEIEVLTAGDATDSKGNKIEPRDLFDAVSNNRVQMVHSASYYWESKIKGASFFSSVPFGMYHEQMDSWIKDDEGLKLWRELYKPYKVIPFPCGHTGPQMGGWFNKEIKSVVAFNGIKMRIPGLGGKVLEKEGATTISVPPQDIHAYGESGRIDAAEWIGPYHDYELKLFDIWRYYYSPGWQEHDAMFELIINEDVYNQLPENLQKLIKSKTEEYNGIITRQFVTLNKQYEDVLRQKHVQFRKFPSSVLYKLKIDTEDVLKDYDNGSTKKIYDSYKRYQQLTSEKNQL
jgi:TRAP-type mannitol/chloroaromatic compound transport system substrate-binding protein